MKLSVYVREGKAKEMYLLLEAEDEGCAFLRKFIPQSGISPQGSSVSCTDKFYPHCRKFHCPRGAKLVTTDFIPEL